MTGQFAFNFEAPEASVEIRRSAARRTLSLEVHPDLRVILRAPMRCPEREITRFLASREAWVERQLTHFRKQRAASADAPPAAHRWLGQPLALQLEPTAPRGVRVESGSALIIGGRDALTPDAVGRAVTRWYRQEASRVFALLIDRWHAAAPFAGFPRPRLTLRVMRTRWGSLSPRTGMCLNVLLIHYPLEAIEYVVVHELCHLLHHGHDRRFYGLLERVLPDWKARKQLLDGRR